MSGVFAAYDVRGVLGSLSPPGPLLLEHFSGGKDHRNMVMEENQGESGLKYYS